MNIDILNKNADNSFIKGYKKITSTENIIDKILNLLKKSNKYEETSNLLIQAGNIYKVQKSWVKAGEAYKYAGDANIKINNDLRAIDNYYNSAHCYKKNGKSNINYLKMKEKVIELLLLNKNYLNIAINYEELSEFYEENGKIDSSIECLRKANQYYNLLSDEKSNKYSIYRTYSKLGLLLAQNEKYEEAINIFEKIAIEIFSNKTNEQNEYFFKSYLCKICIKDFSEIKNITDEFKKSLENKFIKDIKNSINDSILYNKILLNYDSKIYFDSWTSMMLFKIKLINFKV